MNDSRLEPADNMGRNELLRLSTGRLLAAIEAGNPDLAMLARTAGIPHRFDAAMLAAALPDLADQVEALWPALTSLAFVVPLGPGYYAIHELTRTVLLDEWRQAENHPLYATISRRLAGYFDRQSPPAENPADALRPAAREALYHRFPGDASEAFEQFEQRFHNADLFCRWTEAEELLKVAQEQLAELDDRQHDRLAYYRAHLARLLDRWAEVEAASQAILSASRDPELRVWTWSELAAALASQGRTAESMTAYQESINEARALGDKASVAEAEYNLALLYEKQGRLDEARTLMISAYDGLVASGSPRTSEAAQALRRMSDWRSRLLIRVRRTRPDIMASVQLGLLTLLALGVCILGLKWGGLPGLLVCVLFVALLGNQFGHVIGKRRGSAFVPAIWLLFCASCAIGYWAGGVLGSVVITTSTLALFWGLMYLAACRLLPIRDSGQRRQAFRSLVTFSLGRNFPYYAVEDRELVQRASGNPYSVSLAGPGIVLTGPAHAPIVWDGIKFNRISQPGLTFTERFETIYQIVDLRPQLRSFFVEAVTRDGIRIRVLTFVPFRISTKGREPKLHESFPFDEKAIYKVVWNQSSSSGQNWVWDEAVSISATHVLRKIIARYRCDELYESPHPSTEPRVAIRNEFLTQLREELADSGIEILGGGISNLTPMDSRVFEMRIATWRSESERNMRALLGKELADGIMESELAYAETQATLIDTLRNLIEQPSDASPEERTRLAALDSLEVLKKMASEIQVREALPEETAETIAYLRRILGEG